MSSFEGWCLGPEGSEKGRVFISVTSPYRITNKTMILDIILPRVTEINIQIIMTETMGRVKSKPLLVGW